MNDSNILAFDQRTKQNVMTGKGRDERQAKSDDLHRNGTNDKERLWSNTSKNRNETPRYRNVFITIRQR